jgi:hypothetical protein
MGLFDRHSNPFPRSEWARQRYADACYLRDVMSYAYESDSGLVVCTIDPYSSKDTRVDGRPADILTHPNFYMPQVGDERDKIDLAFVLGALTAISGDVNG